MTQILMPKATAVWLIDNTALTFKQISEFCSLHILEVEGIADGDVASGIRGADPIANGQLAREQIEKTPLKSQSLNAAGRAIRRSLAVKIVLMPLHG